MNAVRSYQSIEPLQYNIGLMVFSYRPSIRASHAASVKNGCCTIFTIPLPFAIHDGFPFIGGVKEGWASYCPGL